ncbi:GAF domain-containing protein [Anaerotaenia torta]|uniref:GAF domain-containing protein n=1 Tax=Anaerotaenia torta TaxID=433293 RepID=UPI003D23B174
MQELNAMYPEDKTGLYSLLLEQLRALLEGETYVIPNLSNAAALLKGALKDINWVGFYLLQNQWQKTDGSESVNSNELLLGPFQGKPACIHIPVGKGVCGTAVAQNATQLVEDVHSFPGHIACDSASRSELVIPIRFQGQVVGVLDIDSPILSRFDEEDRRGLEAYVKLLEEGCNWQKG